MKKEKENITYEAAMQQLEIIVAGFEQGNLKIDQLSTKLKEAQELLKFCKSRLLKVEKEVNKILDNEQE
ncbi:exodeoxyribonuclease VII small subunit [gut metagenome]|uniref:Exodeoxyribonuclease VII small subunit n=1 Tax=gut metagenome TaxID=749906 RepID=J9GPX3_9ZZZZ